MRQSNSASLVVVAACSLLAVSVAGTVGCSDSAQPAASGSGGKGSGGAVVSGGSSGAGGALTGSGGATTGSGGSAPGTGGAKTGTGGASTVQPGTGGKTTGTGGALDGGAAGAGSGGISGSTGGRDAGAMGGLRTDGALSTGGTTGDGGSTGGTAADGGGSGVASSGCGKNTAKPNRKTQQTISIGDKTRYYLLNVPSNADANTPLPLVLALHGYDMNNVSLVDLYDFTTESGNKAITALPQGEGPEPGTTSHWGDQVLKSTWSGNAANYDFMQQLIADLESKYCIDTSRVFITGFSMGGMFTNSIACDHNDWFRGFAPVEGGGPGSCSHADAKPAIIIHQGTADTTATPAKGGEPTRDFWTKQNGCNTTTTAMYTGCQSYGACSDPVLYCVGNWGHTVDRVARANIWKFFDSLK